MRLSPSLALLLGLTLSACSGSDDDALPSTKGGASGRDGAGQGGAGQGGAGQGGAGQGGAASGQGGSTAGTSSGTSGQPSVPIGAGGSSGSSAGGAGGAAAGAGGTLAGGAGASGGGQGGGAAGFDNPCAPPDLLIALDRTQTMHATPDNQEPTDGPTYPSSKWAQAIAGIESLVAPPRDTYFRFGLELWPRDPGGGACRTVAQLIAKNYSTNTNCEAGQVVIDVGLDQGSSIQNYLDPVGTLMCTSTPTGTGLLTAFQYLTQKKESGRGQYVVLVTDGVDWQATCPDPDPLTVVQQMAKDGVKTFIVGFSTSLSMGSGVGTSFLNDMACAGQTAPNFATSCKQTATGYVAVNNQGPALYLAAQSATQLTTVLTKATEDIACKP